MGLPGCRWPDSRSGQKVLDSFMCQFYIQTMKTYKLPTAGGRILNVFQDPDGDGFVFQTLTPAGAATYTQKGFESEDILSNGMMGLLSETEKKAILSQV